MSTRSTIGIERPDGAIKCVYCHFDGHPSHHGPILLLDYPTADKIEALLQGGDISILGKVPGLIQDFSHPQEGYTLYYGRDRSDKGTEARACRDREAMLDIAAHNGSEAAYLFSSAGQWLFQSVNWRLPRPAAFTPLKEATIADLRDLIARIPSFTHISEEDKREWIRESQAALEMVSNV